MVGSCIRRGHCIRIVEAEIVHGVPDVCGNFCISAANMPRLCRKFAAKREDSFAYIPIQRLASISQRQITEQYINHHIGFVFIQTFCLWNYYNHFLHPCQHQINTRLRVKLIDVIQSSSLIPPYTMNASKACGQAQLPPSPGPYFALLSRCHSKTFLKIWFPFPTITSP